MLNRRDFIRKGSASALGLLAGAQMIDSFGLSGNPGKPVVSIVKIKNGGVERAVEEAIDLLGGMEEVARNKYRIMLKPNLVGESPDFTTKPSVIRALVKLMKRHGKEVWIGEGSAAAVGFNMKGNTTYRTKKQEILDGMQQYVFDQLGYTDLAAANKVPLINLHTGKMVEREVPGGLLFDRITMHSALQEIDMLCSVPMMKTHVLATVTLGMKNLIGLYPGTVYYSARSWLHEHAWEHGSRGVAFEIVDMVRASNPGLTVIDGSMAMEGNGPTDGKLVKMDLIIAGTNPLATDMVAASVMGFSKTEVPAFMSAIDSGMTPAGLEEVEVRGETIDSVRRPFVKPGIVPWSSISDWWAKEEI
jgi:uncharacterized protein (DUF362 family)